MKFPLLPIILIITSNLSILVHGLKKVSNKLYKDYNIVTNIIASSVNMDEITKKCGISKELQQFTTEIPNMFFENSEEIKAKIKKYNVYLYIISLYI